MRCAKGHDWRADGSSLLLVGKWCRRCHNETQRSTIEEMHAIAHAHGGRCLSTTYRNSQGKLTWECHWGHVWQAVPSPIIQGCWCPECRYDARRDTLENMQKIAAARGGSCLSTTYRNSRTKLTWLCHRGHTWSTTSAAVKFGQWCPTCAHMNKITNPKTLLKYLNKG